jgi:hypothetical protein
MKTRRPRFEIVPGASSHRWYLPLTVVSFIVPVIAFLLGLLLWASRNPSTKQVGKNTAALSLLILAVVLLLRMLLIAVGYWQ